ncbi:MAG: hypothetical protein IKS66_01425, partial [Oscillospiraceae bacterium]|nr:hypothetical protein [Oscillospiraceae bacterium]
MTVLLALLLTLGLVLALAACGQTAQPEAEADLLGRIQARGSIVVATEGDWSPWTYHDDADR